MKTILNNEWDRGTDISKHVARWGLETMNIGLERMETENRRRLGLLTMQTEINRPTYLERIDDEQTIGLRKQEQGRILKRLV